MHSRNRTELLAPLFFALLLFPSSPAEAKEFSCGSRHCVIPYDSKAVQNGTETCYADDTKKEKVRELTWKNGIREGVGRCFTKGKITLEVRYKNNVYDGPVIEKSYDSRGERITFYENGKRHGFQLHVDTKKNEASIAGCLVGEEHLDGFPEECVDRSYGEYDKIVRTVIERDRTAKEMKAAETARKANGKQVEKYSDGTIRTEFTTKNGEMVGLAKSYTRKGKLKSQTHYTDGKRDGESIVYDDDGRVDTKQVFERDVLVSETEFDDNSRPKLSRTWEGEKAKRRMCVTTFFESGAKMQLHCMKQLYGYYSYSYWGEYDGPYRNFDEEGKVLVSGEYVDGDRVGVWKQTSSDGKWKSETTYEKGKAKSEIEITDGDRIERTFNPDGTVKTEVRSKAGMI